MKVLFVDQIATVNYKYTFNLCNALKNEDVEIDLVIDNKDNTDESNVNTIRMFNTADKSSNKIKKIINYIVSNFNILKTLKYGKYNILHLQWFNLSPIDYLMIKRAKRKGIKIVITVHDILPFNEKFYDFKYHKKIYDLADEIIVQAEVNINRFKKLFPENGNKISYIPHGNFANYANIHDKNIARDKLKLPKDKKIVLFFGQIKKVKGLGVLLEAFNEICKEREDIYLVVAGSVWNDDFSIYKNKIVRYNLTDKIRCDIRYIKDEEIEYYYSACDINVLPYLDVYQSGVIQLAYAYKKPVIVTNIKSFIDIVEEDVNGYICRVGDYISLKESIIKAMDNSDKWEDMGNNGNRIILERFSWKDIGIKIKSIYEKQ